MIEEKALNDGTGITKNTVGTTNRVWRYGPLVIWAALIFIGSTDLLSASHTSSFLTTPLRWLFPNASDATLAVIHFVIRKAGHFSEYAIFALLAARAFRTSSLRLLRNQWFYISLLLVIAYSLSDEFHQAFVPSRTASIYDSLIDTFGGLMALVLVRTRNSLTTGGERAKASTFMKL
jgi:VanZ family protein